MKTIEERLDLLENKMRQENFRSNTGLGNEVGYYVFDYDPADELKVRERIRGNEYHAEVWIRADCL